MSSTAAPRQWTKQVVLALALLAGCAGAPGHSTAVDGCEDAVTIGRFKPGTDLFLAQFDVKTDVDDLHAAAAVATLMRHPDFTCVDMLAVAGTYGTQAGEYVPGDAVFDAAFGREWLDAHGDRDGAVAEVARRVGATLAGGGDVWIMEAGQSDFSAAVLRRVREADPAAPVRSRVHVVQHSDWNEEVTTPGDLAFVRATADYRKIPDGNASGNGSPNFRDPDGTAWAYVLADGAVGDVWQTARDVANRYNGTGYDNAAIRAGGFDFSDTVEAGHVFGFDELAGVRDFFDRFLRR